MTPSFLRFFKKVLADMDISRRESLISVTCVELQEMENIFALLILGSFVGLPSPPTFLSVELLPYMERELEILHRRAEDSSDMLAEIVGVLGID
jgi:hypothetical protein